MKFVELDDAKDEVDVLKSGGHWKDHWFIQLITIRGDMHRIFSAPPKQGIFPHYFFRFFFHYFFLSSSFIDG